MSEQRTFYLLAPAGLEGPFATIEAARKADRGRGLDIAENVPPPDGEGVRVVGLRLVEAPALWNAFADTIAASDATTQRLALPASLVTGTPPGSKET